EVVERAVALIDRAEYKRRQAPPGVRLRPKAFGRDRRTPITNRWRGERRLRTGVDRRARRAMPFEGAPQLREARRREQLLGRGDLTGRPPAVLGHDVVDRVGDPEVGRLGAHEVVPLALDVPRVAPRERELARPEARPDRKAAGADLLGELPAQ